ncbi:MAG: DUF484 family protein [Aestuariivita sp.]|nr:DUF484 family protein [Aestuariivita sp.]
MSSTTTIDQNFRNTIISNANLILEDKEIMEALLTIQEGTKSSKVIDLRKVVMQRLEKRYDELESTYKKVITTTYENIISTHQVNQAVLAIIEAYDFNSFLKILAGSVFDILNIDFLSLILESSNELSKFETPENLLHVKPPGFVKNYLGNQNSDALKTVTLRQLQSPRVEVYGAITGRIYSEACLILCLKSSLPPGLLIMGSSNAKQFSAQQGTDLLALVAGVCERMIRHWLN